MPGEQFDNQDDNLPYLSAPELSEFDLELEAIVNGLTPGEMFRQRMEAMGNHVVSDGEPRPSRLRKLFSRLLAGQIDPR
jgi:hypothetical protein